VGFLIGVGLGKGGRFGRAIVDWFIVVAEVVGVEAFEVLEGSGNNEL
jgi:hypothetical protein